MTRLHSSATASLEAKLAELPSLSREQLVGLWEEHMGKPPSKAASSSLLVRAIAYAIQEQQLGGLKRPELRILHKIAQSAGKPAKALGAARTGTPGVAGDAVIGAGSAHARDTRVDPSKRTRRRDASKPAIPIVLKPGTRLVREWQGRSHAVDVRADGFGWNGETYRSLSAVARAITGTHCSGNRFFRL